MCINFANKMERGREAKMKIFDICRAHTVDASYNIKLIRLILTLISTCTCTLLAELKIPEQQQQQKMKFVD